MLLASLPAFAQGLGPALERFKADSFADTEAAIAAVASSGEPRGVDILDALIDSRLFAGTGGVFWRDRAGKGFDAATGAPADIPPGCPPCASTTGCATSCRPRSAA